MKEALSVWEYEKKEKTFLSRDNKERSGIKKTENNH